MIRKQDVMDAEVIGIETIRIKDKVDTKWREVSGEGISKPVAAFNESIIQPGGDLMVRV